MTTSDTQTTRARVGIIGAGFAGLGLAVQLAKRGEDFLLLERGDELGGTWRDNDYPGCACDVPSNLYSFSHFDNPDWSTTFAHQPEILEYTRRLADEHGLTAKTHCNAEVQEARWDADRQRWHVTTPRGAYEFQVLVSATGPLSEPKIPEIPGLEEFEGPAFHSAQWRHDVDLTGKRVAVVGTGASAIQFVPELQKIAAEVKLFQRTPAWTMPRLEFPISKRRQRLFRRLPVTQKIARQALYWGHELYAVGFTRNPKAMLAASLISRAHLRRAVPDREKRRQLTPQYTMGCKRILLTNDYWPALAQDNVEIISGGVSRIGARTVTSASGEEREVDAIVLGTGFHVTDIPIAHAITDAGGHMLAEHWSGGMSAYKGTAVPGFPNLFFMLGPNTGLGHSSMIYMIESAATYVDGALREMQEKGIASVEVRPERHQRWNDGVQRRMRQTVWSRGGCASWYMDEHGRNPTLWPDFTFRFRALTKRFDLESYTTMPVRSPQPHAEAGTPATADAAGPA